MNHKFSGHIKKNFPVLTRRELGNSISAMLRPSPKCWLEHATDVQRRANYIESEPESLFTSLAFYTLYLLAAVFTMAGVVYALFYFWLCVGCVW